MNLKRVFLASLTFANLLFPSQQARRRATLAQLVEQLIRNQQVVGSNPTGGSRNFDKIRCGPPDPSLCRGGSICSPQSRLE